MAQTGLALITDITLAVAHEAQTVRTDAGA